MKAKRSAIGSVGQLRGAGVGLGLVCLLLSGCSHDSGPVGMLVKIWQLPNSHGSVEAKAPEPEPERAREREREPKPVNVCEKQVVYRHRFAERVVYQQAERRADGARLARLEADIRRLTSDLKQAERALIAVESNLAGAHTRAQAVRGLAEARNLIERAAQDAPWQVDDLNSAREKLAQADQQIHLGHLGAAILFSTRAKRIAGDVAAEAEAVRRAKNVNQVRVKLARVRESPTTRSRVVAKLRQGTPVYPEKKQKGWVLVRTPSGEIGWIAGSLLEDRPPASPAR